jgi:hypothetical protein
MDSSIFAAAARALPVGSGEIIEETVQKCHKKIGIKSDFECHFLS